MPQYLTNINVPANSAGTLALTTPSTQLYPYAANAAISPGKELRKLSNSETISQQTYSAVLEYAQGPTGSGTPATILNIPAGSAGVVEKIKFVSSGNINIDGILQISYDGGSTFPFSAELGTLFGSRPGQYGSGGLNSTTQYTNTISAACAHLSTQFQLSDASGSVNTFYLQGDFRYPAPFTNGILIQITVPYSSYSTSYIFTECTVNSCPSGQVPPYQLQSTGGLMPYNSNVSNNLSAFTASTYYGATGGFSLTAANVAQNGSEGGYATTLNQYQIGQLANLTGFGGWVVGLAYCSTVNPVYPGGSTNISFLERNFAWYVDGATPPTLGGSTTSAGAVSSTISACTNSGTTVTATVPSTANMCVGQYITTSGISGFTTNNPNGTFPIASITGATTLTFTAASAPTGTYTASTGTLTIPGPQILTLSNVTNSGTTVTATTSAAHGLGPNQFVYITGITGFTTNNPNGYYKITAVTSSTAFQYVAISAPTGTYTASSGSAYASLAPYGTAVGSPTLMTSGTEDTFDSAWYSFTNLTQQGPVASPPAVPVSGTAVTNNFANPVDVYIQAGGPISAVAINGTTLTYTFAMSESHHVRIPPQGTITLTYTGTAPTWTWIISDIPAGGASSQGFSKPASMCTSNATPYRAYYYNAFLDLLEGSGGYRFNSGLQCWLLTESRCAASHNLSWVILYYKDLT